MVISRPLPQVPLTGVPIDDRSGLSGVPSCGGGVGRPAHDLDGVPAVADRSCSPAGSAGRRAQGRRYGGAGRRGEGEQRRVLRPERELGEADLQRRLGGAGGEHGQPQRHPLLGVDGHAHLAQQRALGGGGGEHQFVGAAAGHRGGAVDRDRAGGAQLADRLRRGGRGVGRGTPIPPVACGALDDRAVVGVPGPVGRAVGDQGALTRVGRQGHPAEVVAARPDPGRARAVRGLRCVRQRGQPEVVVQLDRPVERARVGCGEHRADQVLGCDRRQLGLCVRAARDHEQSQADHACRADGRCDATSPTSCHGHSVTHPR